MLFQVPSLNGSYIRLSINKSANSLEKKSSTVIFKAFFKFGAENMFPGLLTLLTRFELCDT